MSALSLDCLYLQACAESMDKYLGSEQGLMQSNRLFYFCCWLNVNEDLHSLFRREFKVTVVFFQFCHLFTWPIFQSHCSFTQGENSSIIVMSSSEIQSHFKAALIDIAASDYFL